MASAEDQALADFGDHDVITAMRALPEQFRLAVYYADVHGLQCKEIAASDEHADRNGGVPPTSRPAPTTPACSPRLAGKGFACNLAQTA